MSAQGEHCQRWSGAARNQGPIGVCTAVCAGWEHSWELRKLCARMDCVCVSLHLCASLFPPPGHANHTDFSMPGAVRPKHEGKKNITRSPQDSPFAAHAVWDVCRRSSAAVGSRSSPNRLTETTLSPEAFTHCHSPTVTAHSTARGAGERTAK